MEINVALVQCDAIFLIVEFDHITNSDLVNSLRQIRQSCSLFNNYEIDSQRACILGIIRITVLKVPDRFWKTISNSIKIMLYEW